MQKRYLITGGAGFIGSNYIRFLRQRHPGSLVVNLDKLTYAGSLENLRDVEGAPGYLFVRGDICDGGLVKELFEEYKFNYVVNFAAESHVDRSILDPYLFAQTNIMGVVTLLQTARNMWDLGEGRYREDVRFLHVSTDEVYGSLGETGLFSETTPLDPHSPYSASKAAAQLLAKAWADTYCFPVVVTCCSNNYGPYQFPEKLIPLMIHNALQHKRLPIYGDGLQVRDWLYVEDHCEAVDLVLREGRPGEVYNIGGHNERCNIDIVKQVIVRLKQTADPAIGEHLIEHITDRKGHDRRYAIDPAKIRNQLGWTPQTSFEDGLRKTIAWYLSNRDWLEKAANA